MNFNAYKNQPATCLASQPTQFHFAAEIAFVIASSLRVKSEQPFRGVVKKAADKILAYEVFKPSHVRVVKARVIC